MEKNPTQEQLDKFKKKNLGRTSLPRFLVEKLLERLGEIMDTSGMDALGLTDRFKRIRNFNRMEEWKRAVEKFMKAVSENSAATSNLTTASSQTSGLMASTEQDEEDTGKDFRTVTTSLRQILRSEHDLNIVDQQLASEQKFNHEVFEEFSIVIREVTNMVISGKVSELSGNPNARPLDLTDIFPQGYDFGGHNPLVSIAPIPGNVSALIEAGIFSFRHFENLFYGCIGNTVRKEPE